MFGPVGRLVLFKKTLLLVIGLNARTLTACIWPLSPAWHGWNALKILLLQDPLVVNGTPLKAG